MNPTHLTRLDEIAHRNTRHRIVDLLLIAALVALLATLIGGGLAH